MASTADAQHRAVKIADFFLRLPVKWDNQSETWFKTPWILIMSQTKV